MNNVIERLNKLNIEYFLQDSELYVQLRSIYGRRNCIYLHKCNEDGLIVGPFPYSVELLADISITRSINIFSEDRTLKFWDEIITICDKIENSMIKRHLKHQKLSIEQKFSKLQALKHSSMSYTIQNGLLYVAIKFVSKSHYHNSTEVWYCEAIPERHGLKVRIPKMFNTERIILLCNYYYDHDYFRERYLGDYKHSITCSIARAPNFIPTGYKLSLAFYFLVLRKFGLPDRVLQRIFANIYTPFACDKRITFLLIFRELNKKIKIFPKPIARMIVKYV